MLILLVEDDRALASSTITFLNNEGIDVDYADTSNSAKHIASNHHYDAIVIDIGLPDTSGFELAEYFTSVCESTPILFLTAEQGITQKLRAFTIGALDYLTKPFELAELVVRLKLLDIKKPTSANKLFILGDFFVDLNQRFAVRNERAITLSPQQWQLLQLLIHHHPGPVNKTTILDKIWPDTDVTPDMYKTLISRLRSNLTKQQETPILHTIKGVGVVLRDQK